MKNVIAAICMLVSFFVSSGQNPSGKAFEIADYEKLVTLADPQFSPDGRKIAMVVSRPDLPHNRFDYRIVEIDVSTGSEKVWASGYESASQPRWSPDGRFLAFTAKNPDEKGAKSQIHLVSLAKGKIRQVTHAPTGVMYYSWSPNSSSIAFVSQDVPAERDRWLKGYKAFEIMDNDMFITEKPSPAHIHLLDISRGISEKITSGEWSLPIMIPPSPPAPALSWSPDGRFILFVKLPSAYSGDNPRRSIMRLDLNDRSITPFTESDQYESTPVYSPDGSMVCYMKRKNNDSEDINEYFVTLADGGAGKAFSSSVDRDLYRTVWFPDGKSILSGAHDDNKTSLYVIGLDGNSKKLQLGAICPTWYFWTETSVSKTGAIAFLGTRPDHPAELFYMPSSQAEPVCLTRYNEEVAAMRLGKMQTVRWETDGLLHNGILTYPTSYDPAKKYPLVLVIHGGPFAASVEQFVRFTQVLSNKDFFVFEPNYRGSDNQGSAYKLAIAGDAGAGPGRDVMGGLEKVKSLAGIDSSRIGVSGWSYGGFMTVWLAGHYGGWKAAVPGASVTDLNDQYNLSDFSVNRASAMRGSPWTGDNMKRYIEQSPITEARNIKAPTLILGNTGDPRVPIGQSYKLFHALKDNGTEVKFIAWPVPAHNASDPITQMERDRYWLEWMEKYLKK